MNEPFLFGLRVTGLILLASTSVDAQTVLYVDQDAPGPTHDGSSWCSAFTDLQDAFDVAASGTTIRVADGTYTPDRGTGDREATFQLLSGVTLEGGYAGCNAPDPDERDIDLYETILSGDLDGDDGPDFENNGENAYHVVTGNDTAATTILDGFTISHGNADHDFDPNRTGAGMLVVDGSPTVNNCTFTANSARSGGGMGCEYGSPALDNCTFTGNLVSEYGGGMFVGGGAPNLTNCTFSRNSSTWEGGGMVTVITSLTLTHCTFIGNSADMWGGGAYFALGGPTLTNCMFIGNTVIDDGARVLAGRENETPTSAAFTGNSAEGGGRTNTFMEILTEIDHAFSGGSADLWDGGGMANIYGGPKLTNCTFSGNSVSDYGGAIWAQSAGLTLDDCTFAGNSATNGSGIALDSWDSRSTVELANCVLWNGGDEIWNNDGSTITITYSDIQGGWPGQGNIDVDPMFIDADGDDDIPGTEDDNLQLSPGSPCIDAADNTGVPADVADLDGDGDAAERIPVDLNGDPRFVDDPATPDTGVPDPPDYPQVVDMGAYEFQGGCSDDVDCDDVNDCTNDVCEAGDCTYQNRPSGATCGDPMETDCTDPDTCDGSGACLANDAPDGSLCDDGLYCTVSETCASGSCGGGGDRDCDDGLGCTADSCDEANDQCVSGLIVGNCLIGGVCYVNGEVDPSHECALCDASTNPMDWTPRPAGTPCGDPTDSDCDNPDSCDGVGTCEGNNEPEGTPCADDGNRCTDDSCVDKACTHARWPDDDPRACGACCYATAGKCYDDQLEEECRGDVWAVNDSCANRTITCEKAIIPTISEWGLGVLSLLLSIGIATKFARRRAPEP